MKTKNKIRLLFLSVIAVLTLFLIGYQYIRNREINIYLQSKLLSDEKVIDRVLDLKSASFLKPTIDNSAWDDMVKFVKSGDKKWAQENMSVVRKTFEMDYLGVFDITGKNLYSSTDSNESLILIPEKEITEWFSGQKTVHTFIIWDESVYEIFAAAIVPTFDINYTTKEKGYLVSANKWDFEYVTEISKLTGFEIELNQSSKNILTSVKEDQENIYRQIKDFRNTPLVTLRFSKFNNFQSELSNIKFLLYVGFGILFVTIVLFVYFTNKWLTKPLMEITDSLGTGDLSSIRNLLNQNNEFGDIANLIKKFNEQKENLIKEVKEKSEATEKYKALLEAQPDIMFTFDESGTYLDLYVPDVNLLVDNPALLIGKNVSDYLVPDLADKFHEILKKVSSGQKIEPIEYDLNLASGKHTYEARFVAIDNNRVLSIVRDITARKISEEALKNEKQLSDAIIETLPGGFFITDYEGNYTKRNEYSESFRNKELKNKQEENIFQYVYNEDLDFAKQAFQDAKETGHAEIELRFEFQKGIIKWFFISLQKLINDGNSFFIGTSLETTKRKQAEQDLINARDRAEESERLKANFLANMSHELRTPMVGILGYSDLLRSELNDEDQHEMADKIFKSGNRLMETLNLILDLSRIEAGKLEANYSEFDISDSIDNAISIYKNLIESKGLRISYENSGRNIYVNLDERMVRDILYNIINNAIKYTKEGSITVRVNKILVDNIPHVAIDTIDTGIGIPSDQLEVIFEEFRQVSEGLSRGFEGTGLGLSLTKKFVEKMNGFIKVSSELGKGSVFTILLPVNIDYENVVRISDSNKSVEVQNNIANNVLIENNIKQKILVVDNDDTTLMLISAFLNEYYLLDTAKTGKEAINLAHLNKYDLILMDINLGKDDDGVTVANTIKQIHSFINVPVIAVTAFAMVGDKEKFLNSGFTDYISKPFMQDDFLNMIKSVL